MIKQHQVDLIINLPSGNPSQTQMTDGFTIRRLAIDHNVPLVTNLQIAQLLLQCLVRRHGEKVTVKSWREFVE